MPTTRQNALDFLKQSSLGTLATVSAAGIPRARTVYYAAGENFEIYFLTLAGTRKVEDINANHRAAFVISDIEAPQTLQLEGDVIEQPNTTIVDPVVHALMDTLMSMGDSFAPLTHLDADAILLYKLVPTWIRFGDFIESQGTDESLVEVAP